MTGDNIETKTKRVILKKIEEDINRNRELALFELGAEHYSKAKQKKAIYNYLEGLKSFVEEVNEVCTGEVND